MTVMEKQSDLSNELGFRYEEFRQGLIPEWQVVTDRLTQTSKGIADLSNVNLQEGIPISSEIILEIDSLVSARGANPANHTYEQLRGMYYSLPPLLNMEHRVHILDFLTRGLDSEPGFLVKEGQPEKAMLRSRRLASIYEELSVLHGEPSGEHAWRALDLNQQVSQSEHLHIGKSPRKLHATFAIYDIYLRQVTKNYGAKESAEINLAYLDALEMNFHELAEAITTTRSVSSKEESVAGEIGELVLHTRMKDRLFSAGKHLDIEVAQGVIREDHSDELFGKKLSFDLKLVNHRTGKIQPIEVKKLSKGTDANGRPNKYLAPIDVARFRLGQNSREFLEIAEQYCRDKTQQLRSRQDEPFDLELIRSVESIIDPEITRQFIRLSADIETSTNYLHKKDEHPTIFEFAPTAASNT